MGSERGKYVMSVEDAIRREMAYCEHLELMQLIKSTETKQDPAPPNHTSLSAKASRPTSETGSSQISNPRPKLSAIQSSHLNQKPSQSSFPGPRPNTPNPKPIISKNPSPIPGPSSFPRPRPRTMMNPTQLQPRGPISVPRSFFSSQAGPRLNSGVIAGPRPYVPQSPRPSLLWQKSVGPNTGPRPSLLSTPSVDRRFEPSFGPSHKRKEAPTPTQQLQAAKVNHNGKKRKLFCDVCEVQCTSSSNLQMHLMGQKHKAQVKKGKGVSGTENDTPKYCDLCEIWCMNEFSLQQHVSGKSHLKLHAAQKKN